MVHYIGTTMNDDGTFLARWSRRKRDAFTDTREQSKPGRAVGDTAPTTSPASSAPGEIQSPIDLASLPPIESISAASDVRAFLAAGVPADLTRAVLRRVWSSDPAIRDFVGLSENSWDFNAPGAMPGFGPIDMEEVGRLMARLLGEPEATAVGAHPTTAAETDKAPSESDQAEEIQTIAGSAAIAPSVDQRPQPLDTADAANDVTQHGKAAAASQYEPATREHGPPTSRRGHGSALPKFQ
jgi:hypothetical protein